MITSCENDETRKVAQVIHSGWRAGVRICCISASCVLLINIILMIWACTTYEIGSGFGVLYDGNCAGARRSSTVLHVLINLASTVLLSASNYTMQCLNAPTRLDVDRAHAKGMWLDIKVPGWKNLNWVNAKSRWLWWMLACSSLPLHFFYNSAIFLDLTGQEYVVHATNVTPDQLFKYTNSSLTYLVMTAKECELAYRELFSFAYGDVYVLVPKDLDWKTKTRRSESSPAITTLLSRTTEFAQHMIFMTNGPSGDVGTYFGLEGLPLIDLPGGWQSQSLFTGCYSEVRTERCRIKFSVPLMTIVTLSNAVKAICMFLACWKSKEPTLVTLGDAITSFLDFPDPYTKNMCLLAASDVRSDVWKYLHTPMEWQTDATFAYSATRVLYTVTVNILFWIGFLICLAAAPICSIFQGRAAFDSGIGGPSSNSMPLLINGVGPMSNSTGLILNTLLANIPQMAISLLNSFYDGFLTRLILAKQWNDFSTTPKPLRVTTPLGKQNSEYFLSIPYKYAIPLLILSFALHYLVSESLFLVRITMADRDYLYNDSIASMGYSPLAMALAAPVFFLMLLLLNFKGFQRFKPGMPIVGSCSAAISAACHRPEGDENASRELVQWGVVQGAGDSPGSWRSECVDIGHCSFSSLLVAPPMPGRYYA